MGDNLDCVASQMTSASNLALLLRVMAEASPQNQVLAHKLLQNLIKLPQMSDMVLEQAMMQAKCQPG